jgi:light-regulated signal transduction histidine kinase (bacteriophytochrome)
MNIDHSADLPARLRALEAENRALRASKEDLECFVYAISHDLAAPLRAISAFSQLMAEHSSAADAGRVAHYLTGIRTGVERMHELHKCWLTMIRCERAPIHRASVDLSRVAREVCDELRLTEPQRRVEVCIDAVMVEEADPVLTRELLQNLISNAWKFTRRTPSLAMIECGAAVRGGELAYFVRDNGVGFDMQEAARLFQPFQRLYSAASFEGAGVGLAIARRICERHDGRIWAEAESGRGAAFWFTLRPPAHRAVVSDIRQFSA